MNELSAAVNMEIKSRSGNARRRAILVLGMHRSGTSAVTRCLNLLGVDLGSKLLPPAEDNPGGFWESSKAVAIHEALLAAMGRSWFDARPFPNDDWMALDAAHIAQARIRELIRDEFAGSALWAVKDPRLCHFVPLWRKALADEGIDANAILVVRHPEEVAASLEARDRLPRGVAHLNWIEHLGSAERATRDIPRSIVTYEDVLTDWRNTFENVGRDLKLAWPVSVEQAGSDIDVFLNVAERHHRASSGSGAVPDVLERMFKCCSEREWAAISQLVDDYDFTGRPLLAEMGDLSGVANGAAADEASLYFRAQDQAFSADRVISRSHIWGAGQATFRFQLPGESNVTHVRFDPSNAPGAFQVSEIRINGTIVGDLEGRSRNVNRHMLLDQLDGGGVGFLSFDCDPQVEFDLQDELSGCGDKVDIELDCRRLETDNAVASLLSGMLSGLREDVGRQSESVQAAIGRLEAGVVSDLGREVRLQREVDELKAENAQIKARHDALEEREARLKEDVELLRAREAKLFDSGAWMAGLVARLRDESAVDHRRRARLERDNAELQRQQEIIGARLADAQQARDLARRDLDEITSSTLWRVMMRIRRLLEHLSPGTRRLLRRLMKGVWWIVTPWRIPARIAYIRRRRNARRESR